VGGILHLEDKKSSRIIRQLRSVHQMRARKRAAVGSGKKTAGAQGAYAKTFVDRFKAEASKMAAGAKERINHRKMVTITPHRKKPRARWLPSRNPTSCRHPSSRSRSGSTGYTEGGPSRLNLRIDQDDRTALHRRNGQGKIDAFKAAQQPSGAV
jgi:ATP-binding cassette subfamily F protein 3